MKAMIFAAGYGTRLKPYTDDKPKALVPVKGKPLLQWQIEHLKNYGFSEFVINVHHFADQVVEFLKKNDNFGCRVFISDESAELLDTGGGLIHAAQYLQGSDPFLIHNVDIVSQIDFNEMLAHHQKKQPLATVAVSNRKTSRYLWFDENMNLCGWENMNTGEQIALGKQYVSVKKLAYSGIQIVSPEIFKIYQQKGIFSIINMMLELASTQKITAFMHSASEFMDVGKAEHMQEAERLLSSIKY